MADTNLNVAIAYSKKKVKRKQRNKLLKEHVHDFGETTTLHGVRYIADRRLSLIERIFWLITVLASFGICSYWIQSVWCKWRDSPVIVTFNERLESARNVPFPSITICPHQKIETSVLNYSDVRTKYVYRHEDYNDLSNETKRIFENLLTVCKDEDALNVMKESTNAYLVEDMLKVAPEMKSFFVLCLWNINTDYTDCKVLFKIVLTKEGICYNMNSLPINEILRNDSIQKDYEYMETNPMEEIRGWTEEGYFDPNEPYPYPRRALDNGGTSDIITIIFFQFNENDGEICNSYNTGFSVYIQQPQDMPRTSRHFYPVVPNKRASLSLTFSILNSSDNTRSVPVEIRQCYFPGERSLCYFKIYSANNCEMECQANRTMELCNCVHFYLPHNTSHKLCSPRAPCLHNVAESLARDNCNCLPSCHTIDYEAGISEIDFRLTDSYKASAKYRGADVKENNETALYERNMIKLSKMGKFSAMDIYYKQPRYISMRRSLLFGTTDFLSNCGGLLGLFLGFSFLSLVELIYFVSLRLWFALRRQAEEEKEKRNE